MRRSNVQKFVDSLAESPRSYSFKFLLPVDLEGKGFEKVISIKVTALTYTRATAKAMAAYKRLVAAMRAKLSKVPQ